MGWGRQTVAVSTVDGGSGDSGGGARSGGGAAARSRFVASQRRARNAAARAQAHAESAGPFTPTGPRNNILGGKGWSPNDDVPWYEKFTYPEGGAAGESDPELVRANQLQEEANALQREHNANQALLIKIAGQGDQLVNAVLSAVNGGIGGRVGLGFQTPGYAGQTARY